MGIKNDKLRLKRKRSFHGNQYQVGNQSSNVLSGINMGCSRQVKSGRKEHWSEIFFSFTLFFSFNLNILF